MTTIQEIFNNHEIAIGCWAIAIFLILLFTKPAKQFLKTVLPIMFCKKFVVFYIVFAGFLGLILCALHWVGAWDYGLLKDTIFWVLFVEFPLFAKTIEKAKDGHFFARLIRENVSVAVAVEFFIGFWTFSLPTELILIPVTALISCLYALAEHDKKLCFARRFFDGLLGLLAIVLFANAIIGFIHAPDQFFNVDTLKSFLLPLVLLVLNLPVVYGLAVYNVYEQIFIRIKGSTTEQRKMKLQVIRFAGINLSKAFAIRNNLPDTIVYCRTAKDLKENLDKLTRRLELRIGDNYMKRSHYYISACVIGFLISLIGLICANSEVSFKELITMNFVLDVPRIKEILTYIFSTMIVTSVTLMIFAIGFNKKQREDISQIKKYALYELLCSVKRQESQLMEYPPIEEPINLFECYVLNVYEIHIACSKVLAGYENLLTTWEQDVVKQLQASAIILAGDLGITEDNSQTPRIDHFINYYNEKVQSSPQSEKINTFTFTVKTDINKYSKQVNQFCEDFKHYYK